MPGFSPPLIVHSSQIDDILQCALSTNMALSRGCNVGRESLIGKGGTRMNFGDRESSKSAAQLAEDVWRCVWNMQIKRTSGGDRGESLVLSRDGVRNHRAPLRIGRFGTVQEEETNPIHAYFLDERECIEQKKAERELDGTRWETMAIAKQIPWTYTDKRRYDLSVLLFNSTLACYAKLSSSASGAPLESRREYVQGAERLLLEVASRRRAMEPEDVSPSTILQCLQPDVVSFNTAIKAWSELCPRKQSKNEDFHELANGAAERSLAILGLMEDLWEEERTSRSTLQCMEAAWEGFGTNTRDKAVKSFSMSWKYKSVAPTISSYNSVLKSLSRSDDPSKCARAIRLYQSIMKRCNVACAARESLMLRNGNAPPNPKENFRFEIYPDSRTFVLLLQNLDKLPLAVGYKNAVEIAEQVYVTMKRWDEQLAWSGQHRIAPHLTLNDTGQFNPVLNVYSCNSFISLLSRMASTGDDLRQACYRIAEVISEMEESPNEMQRPNMTTYGQAVYAWSCAASKVDNIKDSRSCAMMADDLLVKMIGMSHNDWSFQNERNRLDGATNDAIRAYGQAEMFDEAEGVYIRAKKLGLANFATFASLIEVLAGSEDIAHVDKARQYLSDFEVEELSTMKSRPDMKFTRLYNAVIMGYLSDPKRKGCVEKAESLLSHMVTCHERNMMHIARPNSTSFAVVMKALASNSAHRGGTLRRLEELLDTMFELNRRMTHNKRVGSDKMDLAANVRPNTTICNFLLMAYSANSTPGAVQSAMKLFERMQKADRSVTPDETTNLYMAKILSNEKTHEAAADTPPKDINDVDELSALKIDDIVRKRGGLYPDSFNSIVDACTKSKSIEGAEKAVAFLSKLDELYDRGEICTRPDVFIRNKVMNAWHIIEKMGANVSDVSPAERAQAVLDDLIEKSSAGQRELSPDNKSFSICLRAWCRSPRADSPEKAIQLLRKKEAHARYNDAVFIRADDYNITISKMIDDPKHGVERATALFEESIHRFSDCEGPSRPNAATLNALLNVFAKRRDRKSAEKAESYLRRMNFMHKEGRCFRPDAVSYRSVIDAWILSNDPVAPSRVESLVETMRKLSEEERRKDLRPDSNSYNLIIKACSLAPSMWNEPGDKGETLAIANRAFATLKTKNLTTHGSYSHMMNTYRAHMHFKDERYLPLMSSLWKRCCAEGMVSQFTLESFAASVLPKQFWKAIGNKKNFAQIGRATPNDVKAGDLPQLWRRNVKPLPPNKAKAYRH